MVGLIYSTFKILLLGDAGVGEPSSEDGYHQTISDEVDDKPKGKVIFFLL
jgi:hypothetical protein